MKFKEKYLAGEIPFEEIDRYIEDWGNSEEPCTLREYLGLNEEEEDGWSTCIELREAIDKLWEGQWGALAGQKQDLEDFNGTFLCA